MQVYAELGELTARPSAVDEMRLPHRLYGHVNGSERYSVGRFQEEAGAALEEARSSNRIAIVTGGTGLYFDALTKGLSPIPAVPGEIRENVRRRFQTMGPEPVFEKFGRRDPASAGQLLAPGKQRGQRGAPLPGATGRAL